MIHLSINEYRLSTVNLATQISLSFCNSNLEIRLISQSPLTSKSYSPTIFSKLDLQLYFDLYYQYCQIFGQGCLHHQNQAGILYGVNL